MAWPGISNLVKLRIFGALAGSVNQTDINRYQISIFSMKQLYTVVYSDNWLLNAVP